jgi:NADP-dependent 3-hydroxy acid dehydrogenase YdfG
MEIGVSMVCPGVVDTTLTNPAKEPKPDWLRPETVAEAVLYAATAPANVNVYDVTLFTTWQKPW